MIGVNPRINIFSILDDAPSDTPLTTLNEHSNFGIRSVAFSPDSRWLCSLGNVNDGFIFLWSISAKGSAKLYASNKCVSSVQEIVWMGNSVISVGTRHVKVWRLGHTESVSPTKSRPDLIKGLEIPPSSAVPKAFSGRNCLLGSLIDAVFTSVVAISHDKAILCTEQGDICLLDDVDQEQRLEKVAQVDFSILCVSVGTSRDCIIVAGSEGRIKILSIQELEKSETDPDIISSSSRTSLTKVDAGGGSPDILAIGSLSMDRLFTVDRDHTMCVKNVKTVEEQDPKTILKQIDAHDTAVLGASALHQPNKYGADFFTWASQGTALFWKLDGTCTHRLEIPLDQEATPEISDVNELKILRASSSDDLFVFGDKVGNIGISLDPEQTVRAHNGEINDLVIVQRDNSCMLMASCGRDRILQLFHLEGRTLSLQQTMEDEHAASVNSLLFLNNGSTLVSASADRTVVIRTIAPAKRQIAAYIVTRVLTLKSSPVAFAPMPGEEKTLIVSTMDRQILKYDMESGHLIQSFKPNDFAGRDPVIISSIVIQNLNTEAFQTPVLFGVSSNDRSIRVYDLNTGALLAREHGQLAVSDVSSIRTTDHCESGPQFIISSGLDSTIMIWEFSAVSILQVASNNISNNQNVLSHEFSRSSQPLRRVLSKSDLSDLQRSLDQDPSTPTRSHHPPRLRKKASRLTIAGTPKQSAAQSSRSARRSPSSSAQDGSQDSIRDPSLSIVTPQMNLASRTKRSSSDAARHQPRGALDSNEVVPSAETLCGTLRAFRKRLEVSTEKLHTDIGQELERELTQTIHAVDQKTHKDQQAGHDTSATEPADGWLTRLIDERLSLRLGVGTRKENETQLGEI
ncbi:MAG: hypothetical protein Q9195_000660 [Heterodermia aff. obscurata]